jgi:hypothetical protein
MEDYQTVAINDKGLTVLVEPDNPVVELVSLLLYYSSSANLVTDLPKYYLHSRLYRPP